MMDKSEETFIAHAKQYLDDDSARLDDKTLARLKAAREFAVSTEHTRPANTGWGLIPITSLASVTAIFVIVSLIYNIEPQQQRDVAAAGTDIEFLMSQESFELLDQLEFYQWLDNEDLAG